MAKLRYPIGYSDFREIIEEKRVLVDKTLMIRDVIDDSKVLLFTRPRRFGKSLNLSMLRYFFEKPNERSSKKDLFRGMKIKQAAKHYLEHQNRYPVITLSLKGIKQDSFSRSYEDLLLTLAELFNAHRYLADSDKLTRQDKTTIDDFLSCKPSSSQVGQALKLLSRYLEAHHGEKVLMLIDEYDTPIHAAYVSDYYAQMIKFMRGFLGETLKDNPHLYKAVITGILRVSKENLFSGLNHLEVYPFLHPKYAEYFGFTESEVDALFKKAGLTHDTKQIKAWYNGYQVDHVTLYNPWSILKCVKNDGEVAPYWVNTSDNALIGKLISSYGSGIQKDFEKLMQGESIEALIDEHMTFKRLSNNRAAILNLLFMAGYLNAVEKVDSDIPVEGENTYTLRIPNQEVHNLYHWLIYDWLSGSSGKLWFPGFLADLRGGRLDEFGKKLEKLVVNVFSYYDLKTRSPEQFFHGFTLGLVADMQKDYWIRSNRESGDGRYDIALIPKDKKAGLQGFLFEIKNIKNATITQVRKTATRALKQINRLGYDQELIEQGATKITKIGIAFCGKKIAMASEVVDVLENT